MIRRVRTVQPIKPTRPITMGPQKTGRPAAQEALQALYAKTAATHRAK